MSRVAFLLLAATLTCAFSAAALPVAPEIGLAQAGDGSATVSFTPGPLGGGKLLEYMVVCNNSVQAGPDSPITISGLANGTVYGCRARVTTTEGTSAWSGLSNPVTPAAVPRTGWPQVILWLLLVLFLGGMAVPALRAWAMPSRIAGPRTKPARWIEHLPMVLALGVLWLPGTVVVVSYVAGTAITDPSEALVGVIPKRPAMPSGFQSVANGRFQKEFAASITGQLPFYASISRYFNQAQYALFRQSSNNEILVGRDGYLLHPMYASVYCKRDIAKSEDAVRAWAKTISEIHSAFHRRGQIFLFVLTPSKIEHLPEKLPYGYPCPSPDRDVFISHALKHLGLAGVHYVDARARIHESERRYGYEPFPKGGIHWTDLSAHGAASDVVEKLNAIAKTQIATLVDARPAEAIVPAGEDQDFANLLNLKWPPLPNKTASFHGVYKDIQACPPSVSILAVGGSFFTALGRNLVAGPCPPSVRQLSYLVIEQRRYYSKDGVNTFEMETLDFHQLDTAKVVILEENAGIMLRASHTPALHQYVTKGILPKPWGSQ